MKPILIAVMAVLAFTMASAATAEDIRVGMIGLDTSHVTAFTKLLNDETDPNHIPGAKVVAGYKGGSDDIESSYSRVDKYTQELQEKYGVTIYDTIEEMCQHVDAVMLESVDGRPHLEQVRPVIAAKKPVFIDKPMAGSLHDVIEIFRLAEEAGVPCFSSSSYRYYESLTSLMEQDFGDVRSCISIGPCHLEPHHPDLFWYGVHPTEALFTVMGPGCESVVRTSMPDTDVVTGTWEDGRVGVLYGIRTSRTPHKVLVFGSKSVAEQEGGGNYAPLVAEVVKFFQTKVPPVPAEETINMFAFMQAADESKAAGGAPVKISDVMSKAKAQPLNHPQSTAGWQDLFAPDLSDAVYPEGIWSFENGELTATEDQAIWTEDEYENFVLDLEFKNSPAANSGVFLYCSDMDKWVTSCIEVQILDDYADKWADVEPTWTCGGVFGRLAPEKQAVKKAGEWNRYTIRCAGKQIDVVLNGQHVASMNMDRWTSATENPDGSPAPEWLGGPLCDLPTKGRIGLQGKHAGAPIWFRNMKIKRLP